MLNVLKVIGKVVTIFTERRGGCKIYTGTDSGITVAVSRDGSKHRYNIRDAGGSVMYSGVIDWEEEIESIEVEKVSKRVTKVEFRFNLMMKKVVICSGRRVIRVYNLDKDTLGVDYIAILNTGEVSLGGELEVKYSEFMKDVGKYLKVRGIRFEGSDMILCIGSDYEEIVIKDEVEYGERKTEKLEMIVS
jgi:hypothetical protein